MQEKQINCDYSGMSGYKEEIFFLLKRELIGFNAVALQNYFRHQVKYMKQNRLHGKTYGKYIAKSAAVGMSRT